MPERIDPDQRKIILWSLTGLTAAVVIGNAWICDDIYITLRTIDNFVNGYGLRWNIAERVQSFTHPLWLLLITMFYFVTREGYFTILFISLGLTVATVSLVLFRMSRTIIPAILGTAVLLLSKAFVDYSSSGLETPLSFFLIALFYYIYLRWPDSGRKLFYLSLITSLGALNRPDLVLFFLPAWGYQIIRQWSLRSIGTAALGFIPLICWEIFSVTYYGMPFPNTYYAKLHTGIGGLDLARQGLYYFADSIAADPLTLVTIVLTCLIIAIGGDLRQRMLPAGIVLNLVYILRIGGCFMSGRYFAVPLLASVVLILILAWDMLKPRWQPVFITILAVAFLGRFVAPLGQSEGEVVIPGSDDPSGIIDEKAFYFPGTGLVNASLDDNWPAHQWARAGRAGRREMTAANSTGLISKGAIGMYGYFAGPDLHIVDIHGLNDPLLARLPTAKERQWRIGHFDRHVPHGYFEALKMDRNFIADSNLAAFYDHLKPLVRGDIFDLQRWAEIWNLNAGKYDSLITEYARPVTRITYASLSDPVKEGSYWRARGNVVLSWAGLSIEFETEQRATRLELSIDHNDVYRLEFYRQSLLIGRTDLHLTGLSKRGMRVVTIDIPQETALGGFDIVKILPVEGDDYYSIGHLRLLGEEE